jgi:hypothetical protein
MTLPIRRLAIATLNTVVQHSSADSRSWGLAMLRELELVEDDWAALSWALGSSMALCRHSVPLQLKTCFRRLFGKESSLKRIARSTPAMLSGVTVAVGVLAVCVVALLSMMNASWFPATQERLADRLLVVVLPEIVYISSAAILWRRRKSVATGILLTGVALISHAIVHFATHR